MNFFQIIIAFFIGTLFSRILYIILEIIFIHKKTNYEFYFFLSGFFAFNFLLTYLIVTYKLPEDLYLIIKRWSLFSKNLMVVAWIFAYYKTHFPNSKIPYIFSLTTIVILLTLPFPIFISKPVFYINFNVFNISINMGAVTPHIMYYIGDINLFIFFSLFTGIKLITNKKPLREKIPGLIISILGINFLIDAILLFNYNSINHAPWGLLYQLILLSGFTIIFLMPNIESYLRIKNMFDKIKEDNIRLENLVKERTREIEEKNKQKINLFVNLTHEFKTPLSIIQNYLEEYINESGNTKKLDIIKRNIDKLTGDVINFLDKEKIELGRIIYQNSKIINLSNYIQDALYTYSEYAKFKNIIFNCEIKDDIYIKIDPLAIDRIINNLFDNAIKYTNENGRISVKLIEMGGKIKFLITNSGDGISEEHINNIFSPYYQISNKKSNVQGLGMGLYIVKNIITQIEGNIEVFSEVGRETSFVISLKKHEVEKNEEISKKSYSHKINFPGYNLCIKEMPVDPGKKSILIVEDNYDLLSYLFNSLKENYNIFTAKNGLEALNKCLQYNKIDIIISDIMMDTMDGYEFYENIKNNEKCADIPFIFLTAKTSSKDKLKGLDLGAIDFIFKPFDMKELKFKIKSILENIHNVKKRNLNHLKDKFIGFLDKEEQLLASVPNKKIKNYMISKFNFTDREREVFLQVLEGKGNKEIAVYLNVSVSSIKKHVFNIYRKVGVKSRLELSNILYNNQEQDLSKS